MSFKKFRIINTNANSVDQEEVDILFNLNHIISIKPIRIAKPDQIINGFWIRTTNGKKYRASQIPQELLNEIGQEYQGKVNLNLDMDEQPLAQ
ncbi:MAG TPA: hypothetical protein VKY27_11135 [Bacteriovoracaceae bacterium]|nr:hypothetical protein [Bacteriovoracaceae bacterium]